MYAFEVRTQTLKHAEQSDQIDQHFLGKTILLSWGPRRNLSAASWKRLGCVQSKLLSANCPHMTWSEGCITAEDF